MFRFAATASTFLPTTLLALGPAAAEGTSDRGTSDRGTFDRGTFTVGVERVLGVALGKETTEGMRTRRVSRTDVGLFGTSSMGPNLHAQPRLGLDVAVANGVMIGAAFGIRIGDAETRVEGTDGAQGAQTTLLVAQPRVGYALGFGDLTTLLLRGGLTFHRESGEAEAAMAFEMTRSGIALSLDPTLVITPVAHFGLTFGLVADLPLTGSLEVIGSGPTGTQIVKVDHRVRSLGFTAGLLGRF
jgi:hypothetical protein